MTINIIRQDQSTPPSKSANELEYIEEQTPNSPNNPARTPSSPPSSRPQSDSCCSSSCYQYGLGAFCLSLVIILIRLRGLRKFFGIGDEYDQPSLQPTVPTAIPSTRPSPSPSIGYTSIPSLSSIPTLENGFRSIANEPGVIHLVRDGDCQSCHSEEVQFPTPLEWSDQHEPITSMAVLQGGSIKFYCGGAGANTFSRCPELTSVVQTQQYRADNWRVPSFRTNVYVMFESQVDATSDADPLVTISWESDVTYTSSDAQPSIYYDVNWEVKLYSGYVTVCYGASRIKPVHMQETRLAFEDVPNNGLYWYYPGPPFNDRGRATFFPSNQCFSLGSKVP